MVSQPWNAHIFNHKSQVYSVQACRKDTFIFFPKTHYIKQGITSRVPRSGIEIPEYMEAAKLQHDIRPLTALLSL